MESYKKIFLNFLEKHYFLPLNKQNWNCFKLEHGIKNIFKNNQEKIRKQVGKKSGIYLYKKDSRILYIGKAKSLFGRIKSHNRESFEMVPGDTKHNTWHKFFSQSENKGNISVYWREVEGEGERVIFENMLAFVLKPTFEFFRKRK